MTASKPPFSMISPNPADFEFQSKGLILSFASSSNHFALSEECHTDQAVAAFDVIAKSRKKMLFLGSIPRSPSSALR